MTLAALAGPPWWLSWIDRTLGEGPSLSPVMSTLVSDVDHLKRSQRQRNLARHGPFAREVTDQGMRYSAWRLLRPPTGEAADRILVRIDQGTGSVIECPKTVIWRTGISAALRLWWVSKGCVPPDGGRWLMALL